MTLSDIEQFLEKNGLRMEITVHPERPGVCGHPLAIGKFAQFLDDHDPPDEVLDA